MSDGSRTLQDTLNAINTLRGWGAVSVRVGDVAATFAPAVAVLPEIEEPLTDAEKAAAEERHLFGSADR